MSRLIYIPTFRSFNAFATRFVRLFSLLHNSNTLKELLIFSGIIPGLGRSRIDIFKHYFNISLAE